MPEDYPLEMIHLRRLRLGIGRALLGVAAVAASISAEAASRDGASPAQRLSWAQSPERHFLPPRTLPAAHAVLFDEANDPVLAAALSGELARLSDELYVKQGWRAPFSDDEPLRVYVARRESGGVRAVAGRPGAKGRLESASILLDGSGLSTAQIAREVGRQVVLATLDGYGVEDDFLAPAIAEHLSGSAAGAASEDAWTAAAAPTLDFRARPEVLGSLWVAEVVRSVGGNGILREAWERAAAQGESPVDALDLGAGAGFPGLVLAILGKDRPGFHVHLVESMAKRCRFLAEVVAALDLPATVHNDRAENLDLPVDIVTARACAPLWRLLGYARPYLQSGATGLFLKGQDVVSEMRECARYWEYEADVVPSKSDSRGRIVRVKRLGRARKV